MAYLRFASAHSDYFAVIFNSGIDKSKYPEVQRSAQSAFGVILGLAQHAEPDAKLAQALAVSAWALVHGLAALISDGALPTAADQKQEPEYLRPIVWRFLTQAYS